MIAIGMGVAALAAMAIFVGFILVLLFAPILAWLVG